jgi:outer membrane receptor protein involved in Fe transport
VLALLRISLATLLGIGLAKATPPNGQLGALPPGPPVPYHPQGLRLKIAGTVLDSSGAAIANAQVVLKSGSFRALTTTDGQGGFGFEFLGQMPAGMSNSGALIFQAPGFASSERTWSAQDPDLGQLQITLQPASVSARMTVTAMRTSARLNETAADARVLTSEDLASTSALRLDDALRQVPGFMLFRRSGSRAANPTSQGVSLRGVGASGPSRALVLEDGIPLVDPFGGWVYWDRVPREEIGSVEAVEGGASDLYGSDALGGVINVRARPIDFSHLSLEASYGNENTPDLSLSSSLAFGKWSLGFSTEAFHTDGYVLVPEDLRGPIDNRAGVDDRAIDATLERRLSDRARVFVHGDYLGEQRQNGKVNEGNHANIRQLTAGADWQSSSAGSFSLRGYGGPELLDQNFYAVGPDRLTETLTDVQRVPVQDIGFSAQWSRGLGSLQTLVAGFEAEGVRGSTNEFKFVGGSLSPSSAVGAGGRQRTFAGFGEDIFHFGSKWVVTVGARVDHWSNYDALSTTQPLAKPGPTLGVVFPDRTEQALSPRLSVLRQLSSGWSLTGSIYRAFRAPTLNELYRSFRLSNVLTLANNELLAERLTGAEGGVNWTSPARRTTVRAIFFWSDITRPIENVTLSETSNLILRQRENLGRTRARGISLDFSQSLTQKLGVTVGYHFTDSTVVSFPADKALVGLRVPEVPRHEATFQVRYSNPAADNRLARFTVGLQGRAESATYDNDLNTLRLDPYFSLDALASYPVARGTELFAAAENLTNQRYQVALTPVANLGPPILMRVGIRFDLGQR